MPCIASAHVTSPMQVCGEPQHRDASNDTWEAAAPAKAACNSLLNFIMKTYLPRCKILTAQAPSAHGHHLSKPSRHQEQEAASVIRHHRIISLQPLERQPS